MSIAVIFAYPYTDPNTGVSYVPDQVGTFPDDQARQIIGDGRGRLFGGSTAMSVTLVQAMAANQQLATISSSERAISSGKMTVSRTDRPSFSEGWANLTAWAPSGAVLVSGSKVYGISGQNPGGVAHTFPISSGQPFRYVATITLVGGGNNLVGIGLTNTSGGQPIAANGAEVIFWGFNGATPHRFSGIPGIAAAPLALTGSSVQAFPNGTYTVCVSGDNYGVSASIVNSTHTLEAVDYVSWGALGATTGIMIWNSDLRGTSGSSLNPLSVTQSYNTTTIDGFADTIRSSVNPTGDVYRFVLPKSYDSRIPTPVIMYFHGAGENAISPYVDTLKRSTIQALSDAGYVIASCTAHGNGWGNQASLDDYLFMYGNMRDSLNLGHSVVIGQSMGGLPSLLTVAGRKVPGIAGWAGIYPATNLADVYLGGSIGDFGAEIRTAYGIASNGSDYAAKTVGHDPNLLDPLAYRGIPMRFYHSPADTVVRKSKNTDLFAPKVAGIAPEADVIVTSGEHGDPSNFQTADLLAFVRRCLRAAGS